MPLLTKLLGGVLDKIMPEDSPRLWNGKCLRDRFLRCKCHACLDACVYEAWKVKEGLAPELDPEKCVGCGLCVSSCPVDAITFDGWGYEYLLFRLEQEEKSTVVACVSREGMGYVRVPCLGFLPWEILVAVALSGKTVELVCGQCSLCGHEHGGEIAGMQAAMANAFLTGIGANGRVKVVNESACEKERQEPLLGRRGMFHLLGGEAQMVAARLLEEGRKRGKQKTESSLRKILLSSALRRFEKEYCSTDVMVAFWNVEVAPGACNSCGLCACSCPGSALSISEKGQEQVLLFQPLGCTGCGLCEELCPTKALELKYLSGGGILDTEKVVNRWSLAMCPGCGTPIDPTNGPLLCPECYCRETVMVEHGMSEDGVEFPLIVLGSKKRQ